MKNSIQGASLLVQPPNKPIEFLSIEEDKSHNENDRFIQVSKKQLECIHKSVELASFQLTAIEYLSELTSEDVNHLGCTLYNAQKNLKSLLEIKDSADASNNPAIPQDGDGSNVTNSSNHVLEKTKPPLFPLGTVYLTTSAFLALTEAGQTAEEFLIRHQRGDWGYACRDEDEQNLYAVEHGFLILSSYRTKLNKEFYVITKGDRSSTHIRCHEDN